MSDPILHPEQVEAAAKPPRKMWRVLAYVIGLGLLAASVTFAINKADWSHVWQARPRDVAMLCLFVLANIGTNCLLFWLITKPFEVPGRPVKLREWLAMIAGTSLLNYAGAKAGLLGRIAYLKKYHGIGYRANVFTLVTLAAGTSAIYVLLGLLTFWRDGFDVVWGIGLAVGLAMLSGVGWIFVRPGVAKFGAGATPRRDLIVWIYIWGVVRVLDALAIAGRFMVASQIMDKPMDIEVALLAAVVCNFAVMAAPVPGGLGLREWLGGWVAKSGFRGAGKLPLATGVGILVVDRAAEIAVFIVTGVIGLVYLHHRANVLDARGDADENAAN
ncbi:MAG: hypothetical protein GC162_12520 [Planctomycetes bacterium]|nr:hypothetical protein [Planctomycetota bacterium]